jgi:DNA repair photolyase
MSIEYIKAKTIISGHEENNYWFGKNYNMNIYKGCSHGCIYCDSRSECYSIEDFDRVRAKENSTGIIRGELKSKKKKGIVATGAMSDPYNPYEKTLNLTREALEQINKYNFGIAIATKSPLVTRDIDILKEIQNHSPVIIKITITTFEDDLCKKIESNVSTSSERFQAVKTLRDNGIYAGVLLMPILPFINDTEENIKNIVRKTYECGGKFVYSGGIGVTLRQNQRQHFYKKLINNFPSTNLVKKYIDCFGEQYECRSIDSKRLWAIFKDECTRYGLLYKMEDIIEDYKKNYGQEQISMF